MKHKSTTNENQDIMEESETRNQETEEPLENKRRGRLPRTPRSAVATEPESEGQAPETETPDRNLKYADKETSSHKVKVVFTRKSGRSGERTLMNKGMAALYERQGIVDIVKEQ